MEDTRLLAPGAVHGPGHGAVADAGEPDKGWRRGAARASMLLLSSLRAEADPGAPPISIRVRNISAGGLMAECDRRFAQGERVEVELRGIGPVRGVIAWFGDGRLGIAFDRAIDPKAARRPVGGGMMTSRIQVAQDGRRPGLR